VLDVDHQDSFLSAIKKSARAPFSIPQKQSATGISDIIRRHIGIGKDYDGAELRKGILNEGGMHFKFFFCAAANAATLPPALFEREVLNLTTTKSPLSALRFILIGA
jgi:hypothetical protein